MCYSQIDFSKDPSSWPNPFDLTLNERIDAGYTHDKVITYLKWREKWRMKNLPNLYLKYDQLEKVRELVKHPYKLELKKNHKRKYVLLDSLDKMDVKDYSWMKQKLDNDPSDSPCRYLEDHYYNIYLVKLDSSSWSALLQNVNCAHADPLADDDLTDYEVEKQGDTLIIIKYPVKDNN